MPANGVATNGGAHKKAPKMTRNQKRRLKKKRAKERARAEAEAKAKAAAQAPAAAAASGSASAGAGGGAAAVPEVTVEYVPDTTLRDFLEENGVDTAAAVSGGDEGKDGGSGADSEAGSGTGTAAAAAAGPGGAAEGFAAEFARIFQRFATPVAEEEGVEEAKAKKGGDGSDSDEDAVVEAEEQLSRRQRKKLNRLSVAQLKQLVARPDVVEAHDVTSSDPRLLVYLKAYRNTVPVPRHWCAKRKYLQGKRGIERPPFELPEFISDTGITKIRSAVQEMEDKKTTKQRQRERSQPKMGKVNIDYQVLHDAFFKFQTKPHMTNHGDIYYEGKEFEVQLKNVRPGVLSDSLKQALGMPEGAPPPWLVNMQRYGPPPAYSRLPIPGLNAPIPPGASYGYHPGGWGRPPVDAMGKALYGDPFGTGEVDEKEEEVDKTKWGELVEDSSESESEEEESEAEDEDEDEDMAGGTETPMEDGTSTMVSGLSTPATIDLRKGLRKGVDTPATPTPELYQVLQAKATSVGSAALMGSSHTYVIPGSGAGAGAGAGTISMEPSQLESLDDAALQARFAAQGTSTPSEGSTAASLKRKRREEKAAQRSSKKARDKFKF